jgi:hypothetical protein
METPFTEGMLATGGTPETAGTQATEGTRDPEVNVGNTSSRKNINSIRECGNRRARTGHPGTSTGVRITAETRTPETAETLTTAQAQATSTVEITNRPQQSQQQQQRQQEYEGQPHHHRDAS